MSNFDTFDDLLSVWYLLEGKEKHREIKKLVGCATKGNKVAIDECRKVLKYKVMKKLNWRMEVEL